MSELGGTREYLSGCRRPHGVAGVAGPPMVGIALLKLPSGRRLVEATWGEHVPAGPVFGLAELPPAGQWQPDTFDRAIAGAVGVVVAQLEARRTR